MGHPGLVVATGLPLLLHLRSPVPGWSPWNYLRGSIPSTVVGCVPVADDAGRGSSSFSSLNWRVRKHEPRPRQMSPPPHTGEVPRCTATHRATWGGIAHPPLPAPLSGPPSLPPCHPSQRQPLPVSQPSVQCQALPTLHPVPSPAPWFPQGVGGV